MPIVLECQKNSEKCSILTSRKLKQELETCRIHMIFYNLIVLIWLRGVPDVQTDMQEMIHEQQIARTLSKVHFISLDIKTKGSFL